MAIAFVQAANSVAGSAASLALAFGSNNTAGNMLLLTTRSSTGNPVISVTDSNGNDWQKISTFSNSTSSVALFYAPNCKAGANTVTLFRVASTGNISMVIMEYSGVNTLDQSATAGPTTSNSFSSGNITTTQANELLIGYGANETSNGLTITPTNSFTLQTNASNSGNSFLIDRVVSSTGTFAATTGFSSSVNWAGGIATFYNDPNFPGQSSGFVQSKNGTSSVGASVALAYPSNNTAGNLLVAICRYNNGTSPTITDTAGNSWQTAVSFTNGASLVGVFYVLSAIAGANTVTFNATGASRSEQAVVLEYAVKAAFDQEVHASGSSVFPTSAAITTTPAFELAINYVENESANSISAAPFLGYIQRDNANGNVFVADRVIPAGTYTNIYGYGNSANVSWGTGIVAFKIAFGISGSAGTPGANVAWTGGASANGSVVSDGSGNYNTGEVLLNSAYTITPTKTAFTFSPVNSSQTVAGADISGVNFTATNTKVATPTFSPVAGTYSSTQSVTVSSTDSGLSGFAMYYTTDGSTPTTGSTPVSGAISVSVSETLKVLAVATGYANSNVASAGYTISSSVVTATNADGPTINALFPVLAARIRIAMAARNK